MATDFDLVLFDCDGVLVDSEEISCRCAAETFREAGYPIDAAGVQERFLGLSNATMVEIVERDMGRPLPDDFFDALHARELSALERELRPIAGVHEAIDSLDIRCCVASSSRPDRIHRSLVVTQLDDRLGQHVFSASMVANGKPAPDLFLYAAEAMGAQPNRCVVIEDSVAGVQGGKAAGMTVIGFTGGSHVEATLHGPRLLAAGADRICTDMAALPDLLRQTAGPMGRA